MTFNTLLTHIREEFSELDPATIIDVIHDRKNVLLVWWYEPKEDKLEYFDDAPSHTDYRFSVFKPDASKTWEKGRLVTYKGKIILLVYSAVFGKTSMGERDLRRLVSRIEAETGKAISIVINQRGDSLLIENKEVR